MRRALLVLAAALQLTACPQLVDDPYEKGGESSDEGAGHGGSQGTGTVTTGIIVTDSVVSGTGGSASSGSGGLPAAGAPGTDGNSEVTASSTSATTSGATSTSATATTGGTPSASPTTLVYATLDNEIFAATWSGTHFSEPERWSALEDPIGFVETRLSPDQSWSVTAHQSDSGGVCTLYVQAHRGTEREVPIEISMGADEDCASTRGFDIAFEQFSGRALLVYATMDNTLEYCVLQSDSGCTPEQTAEDFPAGTINWVRLVPDAASNRIALGYSTNGQRTSLMMQEWDGEAFSARSTLANDRALLDSEAFDFAYVDDSLLAIYGDDVEDGFRYRERDSSGSWTSEERVGTALDGSAQLIALQPMTYGVVGALYDAVGAAASFGTLVWADGAFAEAEPLDSSLPSLASFEPASQKADVARLGNVAVTVYCDRYASGSALGWALRSPEGTWESQQDALPIAIDQESGDALPRSIRLAHATTPEEALILAFADEDGLHTSFMTDVSEGWSAPVLVEARVDGSVSTPFGIGATFP